MQEGKLTNEILRDIIISKIERRNKDVIVGPEIGEDCSMIDFGDEVCVITTDPVTAAQENMGNIGVHICCNDIASAGVKPLGVMVTILAPLSSSVEDIGQVMREVNEACNELQIDVLGGHTEITSAVNRMVLSITAIGRGKKEQVVTTGGAKIGDDIIVTGFSGTEGTGILSKKYSDYLLTKLPADIIDMGKNMLKSISVVDVGMLAGQFGVNAMHDATEGGILGAIWEVAEASNKGMYIYEECIPIKKETIKICAALNINPYRLISSGCMIITCSNGIGLCNLLSENSISASIVGRITEDNKLMNSGGLEGEVEPPESDEIYNVKID
jgi:hydrogenase maturation factor